MRGTLPGQPTKHAGIRSSRARLLRGEHGCDRALPAALRTHRARRLHQGATTDTSAGRTVSHGVALDAQHGLPVVWAVRTSVPQRLKTLPDGSHKLMDAEGVQRIERLSLVPTWKKWTRVDGKLMHELSDGSLVLDWYFAVAERIARPKEVGKNEPWVHVDEGEQTLVLYVGDQAPKYATLVSSGVSDHKTPLGSFRIQRKYVSDHDERHRRGCRG